MMSKCPNCGYCPHCGRRDTPRRPRVVPMTPPELAPIPNIPQGPKSPWTPWEQPGYWRWWEDPSTGGPRSGTFTITTTGAASGLKPSGTISVPSCWPAEGE